MLRIKFISNEQIKGTKSSDRIRIILDAVRENYIILMEGKLKSTEEASLIRETMNMIDQDIESFSGIEISVLHPNQSKSITNRIKNKLADLLLGTHFGLTIIGPASIIKELRKDTENMEIHFNELFITSLLNQKRYDADAA